MAIIDGSSQSVKVPANYVLYQCKVGPGKFVCLPLPPELTYAEAARISRFVLTQTDDEPGGELIDRAFVAAAMSQEPAAATESPEPPEPTEAGAGG